MEENRFSVRVTGASLLGAALFICSMCNKEIAFYVFFSLEIAWFVICIFSCICYGNVQDLETGKKASVISFIMIVIGVICI